MPGMEVNSDGTVKVNGEKAAKITAGGKTFFFNDPLMTVKNLPVKIVEKIKVIDKRKVVRLRVPKVHPLQRRRKSGWTDKR